MDDGNLKYDAKFLDIVRPYGIKGTFNLCHANFSEISAEELRDFYRGYEISNHCKYHPIVFDDNMPYNVSEDKFDPMTSRDYTPEDPVVYKTEIPGLYRIHHHLHRIKPDGWYSIAEEDYYCRFVDEAREQLESVFGEGSVRGYVWPCFEQKNSKVKAHLKQRGYYGARKTGDLSDKTNYALPEDRMAWVYNASHRNLLAEADKYDEYPDDGKLKFFSFGVHPADFERSENWCDLIAFCKKFGNRPEDYYYASIGEIFDYQDAVESLIITDEKIVNKSDVTVYIKIDGERVQLCPHSETTI